MRIGIDARFLTHPQPGGFRTYTRSLVAALAEVDRENEYVLYVDRVPETTPALGPNFRVQAVPEQVPVVGMVWREQASLARRAAGDRLDLFHAPCLTGPLRLPCPSVVTLHDMIWHQRARPGAARPTLKRAALDLYYRQVPARAARAAAAVITISQDARGRILQGLGLPPDRVRVTYLAGDPRFRPVADAGALAGVRARFGLPPDFLLATGSADPRKNILGLVTAYAALPAALQERHPLAVVWAHRHLVGDLSERARALGVASRLHFLQGVTDEDLVLLYNAALLFAFPSRYEGFGLPLLEAMACGTPVVAADNSSIPEVVGDAALLVGAEDGPALTGALTRVLTEDALRERMARRGASQAAQFSWARCARETVAIYREAALGADARAGEEKKS